MWTYRNTDDTAGWLLVLESLLLVLLGVLSILFLPAFLAPLDVIGPVP